MTFKVDHIDRFDNGFVQITFDPGPDTVRITVLRHGDKREVIFCLSGAECTGLADRLDTFALMQEEKADV